MKSRSLKVSNLPTEKDFDPWGGDLDAQWACDNFCGLTVEQAYEKFCSNPENYQEDFMFMGPRAFLFYFHVIEKYLQEVEPEDEYDDCCFWIIGCGLKAQLEVNPGALRYKARDLVDLVLERLTTSRINNKDKKRVSKEWKKLKVFVKSLF